MSRAVRRLSHLLSLAALFGVGIAVVAYEAGGASFSGSALSPDGKERLDYYNGTRWQMLRSPNDDMTGFVRLVRVAGDEVSGTSDAFEQSGSGPVIWDKDYVQVGTSARFDRATGKWTVQRY